MSKTFTVQQFEIEFYRAMAEWVGGGKVGPDPRGEIEFRPNSGWNWREAHADQLEGTEGGEYRWKQPKKRTVIINGLELVVPEVEVPETGSTVWLCCSPSIPLSGFQYNECTNKWLKSGEIFLTREDAEAMADAQRKQRRGGWV